MQHFLKLFILLALAVATGFPASALTDRELIAVRDGFGERRDAALANLLARPHGGGINYALAALYLNKDVQAANEKLIAACEGLLNGKRNLMQVYSNCPRLVRIYRLFAHDSDYFPGRLTAEAEAKMCELMWTWAKSHSRMINTDIDRHRTWAMWGSENHDAQNDAAAWGTASILKDVAPYNTYKYDDGSTAQAQHDAWTAYLKAYLRERAKKGLFLEIGTPTYTKYTLKGVYNYYDFAEDAELKVLAGILLDLWWADWAESQINGVWGGGKARVKHDSGETGHCSASAMAWHYLSIGTPNSKHPTVLAMATTSHRLPLVVMDLALDVSGRGVYEKSSRRPGLRVNPQPDDLPDERTRALNPDNGGILRYTYVRPEFILGTLMLEKRPREDWWGGSMQSRWIGVTFANDTDARIYPTPKAGPTETSKTYNALFSVQNKGTLIAQKIKGRHNGPMRVFFSSDHLDISESGGCVFASSGDAFAAVRIARGGYEWDDANWIRLDDEMSPVIMEVAPATDYDGDLDAFKKAVLAREPSILDGILTYRGLGDLGTFTFDTQGDAVPTINGKPVDFAPDYTFKSPFLNEAWASGIVTIEKGDRKLMLDFNKGEQKHN